MPHHHISLAAMRTSPQSPGLSLSQYAILFGFRCCSPSIKMSGKRKSVESPAGSSAKKQRKAIDIEMKMKIIKEQVAEGQKKFTAKGLATVFSKLNSLILDLEAMDPNVERLTKVERHLNEGLRCYREIYEEKKKQTRKLKMKSRD